MSSSDAPPTSRRALRARAAAAQSTTPDAADTESAEVMSLFADLATDGEPTPDDGEPTPVATPPTPGPAVPVPATAGAVHGSAEPAAQGRVALGWVDPDTLTGRRAPGDLSAATSAYVPVLPDLLPRRRGALGALLPLAAALALVGGYTAATQLWPLDNVAPVAMASDAPTVTAPVSTLTWPDRGLAAAGVQGFDAVASSSDDRDTIASITKLVSVLMVLEERPLAPGEQGEERSITSRDRADYWNAVARGESALDVPAGGTLTEYQLMQGTLISSAGNYARMLTRDLWPTDEAFASAAAGWLDRHDLSGITVVEPTGIDRGNTADTASLIRLGVIALAHPVVAEIVATRTATLPGVGEIENTNPLLADDTVVGTKTGTLDGDYNLLAAQDVAVGDTTVRVHAVVLGQLSDEARADETADLLQRVAAEASVPQALPAGTAVGTVTTPWGADSGITTTADAAVLLWNGASAAAETTLELGEARTAGDAVGVLTLTSPLGAATSPVALTADLPDPDFWWRFTHPLELFGLTDLFG